MDTTSPDVGKGEPVSIEQTQSGTKYIFPISGRISEKELKIAVAEDEDETESSDVDEETNQVAEVLHTTTTRNNVFPKVVFFGTGSSFPGVTKTATAILLHTA